MRVVPHVDWNNITLSLLNFVKVMFGQAMKNISKYKGYFCFEFLDLYQSGARFGDLITMHLS